MSVHQVISVIRYPEYAGHVRIVSLTPLLQGPGFAQTHARMDRLGPLLPY